MARIVVPDNLAVILCVVVYASVALSVAGDRMLALRIE